MYVKFAKENGFTFIELLIALVVNIILLSALLAVFANNLGHYTKVINIDTLTQQLQIAMNLMENDIRRAGYWSNASNDINTGQNNNPFMATGVDVQINGTNNCILFAYDYNSDGSLPNVSSAYDDERYGFRLNGQTLQTRPPGAAFDCNAGSNAWESITNNGLIQITALTFTLSSVTVPPGQASNTMNLRTVTISITGQLTTNTAVTKTLTQQVRIRNDKFTP